MDAALLTQFQCLYEAKMAEEMQTNLGPVDIHPLAVVGAEFGGSKGVKRKEV